MSRAISLLFHDVYTSDPAESGFVSDAADRYKLSLAGFEAHLDGVAKVRSDAPAVVGSTQSTRRSGEREVCEASSVAPAAHSAATDDASAISAPLRSLRSPSPHPQPPSPLDWLITVDDGGVSYHTHIADALESRGWRGHCFVTTGMIGRRGFLDTALLRDLDVRGHVIASHSATHPTRFSACSYPQMVSEWRQSRAVLEDILGHAVTVASIPGGYFSPAVAQSAREAGIDVLFTSEPVTTIDDRSGVTLIGRFTIRQGDRRDASMRLVSPSSWARTEAWLRWNAKGLVKPLLGPAYMRVADMVCTLRRSAPASAERGRP